MILNSKNISDDRIVPAAEHADLHAPDLAEGDRIRPLLRGSHAENLEVSNLAVFFL